MNTERSGSGSRVRTVLLVEDDPAVRRMLEVVVRGAGYRVVTAPRGDDALALVYGRLESGEAGIDALLSDVVMPGTLDGPTLALRLQERIPGLGVVLTSGYVRDSLPETSSLPRGTVFVQKPFQTEELLTALRRVLKGESGRSG